jgi:hypothetical protein
MNVKINGLIARIIGIVAILIAVTMIGPIYTANAGIQTAITNAVNEPSFLVLPTLLPFGPIIILLGLLFAGGLLVWKGEQLGAGISYIIGLVVSVVGVIMVLSFFPSLVNQFDATLTTLIGAGDTIGELFVGTVLPLLIYLLVAIAPAVTPGIAAVRGRKGKKGKTASALAY